jgi:hypothetical protein
MHVRWELPVLVQLGQRHYMQIDMPSVVTTLLSLVCEGMHSRTEIRTQWGKSLPPSSGSSELESTEKRFVWCPVEPSINIFILSVHTYCSLLLIGFVTFNAEAEPQLSRPYFRSVTARHVAGVGQTTKAGRVVVWKPEGKRSLGRPGIEGRIILNGF